MSWITTNSTSMTTESFETWLAKQSGSNRTKISTEEEFSKNLQAMMKTGKY